MIKGSAMFYGEETDEYGIPKPFHSYLVIASPWQTTDAGIASMIPMSDETPMPFSQHAIVEQGGEQAAFEEAVQVLRHLSANQHLKIFVDKEY